LEGGIETGHRRSVWDRLVCQTGNNVKSSMKASSTPQKLDFVKGHNRTPLKEKSYMSVATC